MNASQRKVAVVTTLVSLALLILPGVSWPSPSSWQIETDVADLREVRVLTADPFDSANEMVAFCFDTELHSDVVASKFSLVDFNPAVSLAATAAVRSASQPSCVEVQFQSGIDVAAYSLGAVATGAVKNVRGFDNVQASAPLQGSTVTSNPGDTTRPELVGATPDPAKNAITYTFDENLDPTITKNEPILGLVTNPLGPTPTPAPARFKFQDASGGTATSGTDIISISKNAITVAFPSSANVAVAVRFSVDDGAVADRQKGSRQGQLNPLGGTGGATTRPDLARALPVPGTAQVDFDFDELVEQPSPAGFLAFAQDGQQFAGSQAVGLGNGRVRVTFAATPGATEFPEKLVAVAVTGTAVKASDNQDPNTVGWAPLRPSGARPGFTSGPDLTGLDVDIDNASVTYMFDSAIQRTASATAFKLVTRSGAVGAGTSILAWGNDWVKVGFLGTTVDIKQAVGATADAGAVKDPQGNTSPVATMAAGARRGPGFPITSPSTPTSPSPTATPRTPLAGRPSNVSISDPITERKNRQVEIDAIVTDDFGTPIPDVQISFSTIGVGQIVSADERTDVQGRATVTVASTEPGTQGVTASIPGCAQEQNCSASTEVRWVQNTRQLSCTIVGTMGDDILKGTDGDDTICALDGADIVIAGRGDDVVLGGRGADLLAGKQGADVLEGEDGDDRLLGGAGDDTLRGGRGNDRIEGGRGQDICVGTSAGRKSGCER